MMTTCQKYAVIVFIGILVCIMYHKTKYIEKTVVFCNSWKHVISNYTSIQSIRTLSMPRKIFLSYTSSNLVPEYIWNQYCKYAKGYEIQFFDNKACLNIIKLFGENVVNCYNTLSVPAHKCDLWRYCILYIFGGIYFDIKTILTRPISEIFPYTDTMYTVLSLKSKSVYQGIICVPPAHPIIADAISNMITNKPTKLTYLQVTQQLYGLVQNYLGYEPHIGVNYSPFGTIQFFQEKQTNHCTNRDRYNYCEIVALNESNETMCIIRDPRYPYKKKQEVEIPSCIQLIN